LIKHKCKRARRRAISDSNQNRFGAAVRSLVTGACECPKAAKANGANSLPCFEALKNDHKQSVIINHDIPKARNGRDLKPSCFANDDNNNKNHKKCKAEHKNSPLKN